MSSPTPEHEYEPPVVRDKRRIDPTTGAVRPESQVPPVQPPAAAPRDAWVAASAGAPGAGPGGASTAAPGESGGVEADAGGAVPGGGAEWEAALAERTADLQRLQAEYANYRRRVERDREAVRELATIAAITELLPVLDNVERARAHGEVVGGFKVVAESLEATLGKLGLVAYGEAGDPFDPNVHEALMHEYSAEVAEAVCVEVLQAGYKVGERIVRPARVKVAEPDPAQPAPAAAAE